MFLESFLRSIRAVFDLFKCIYHHTHLIRSYFLNCGLWVVDCELWIMCKFFHYKDRIFYFFLICALKIFFRFPYRQTERTRESREKRLSHRSRFIFFFTSSATGATDDLASVEREERKVRLGASAAIGTSGKTSSSLSLRKTSSLLSLSGRRRGSETNEEEATFARGLERKPGRSADSSWSRAKARGESALKGLVIIAGTGSSNASRRASFVGFSFLSVMYIDENCFWPLWMEKVYTIAVSFRKSVHNRGFPL